MPFHAFFGIIVMSSEVVIAETFYQYLDLPWANDLLATQYLGGGIAWAGGELPLLIVVIALVTPLLSGLLERRAASKGRLSAESPYRTPRAPRR